jgi:hypothetical protein
MHRKSAEELVEKMKYGIPNFAMRKNISIEEVCFKKKYFLIYRFKSLLLIEIFSFHFQQLDQLGKKV